MLIKINNFFKEVNNLTLTQLIYTLVFLILQLLYIIYIYTLINSFKIEEFPNKLLEFNSFCIKLDSLVGNFIQDLSSFPELFEIEYIPSFKEKFFKFSNKFLNLFNILKNIENKNIENNISNISLTQNIFNVFHNNLNENHLN